MRPRLHTADFDRNKAADRFSKDKLSTAITLTMIVYMRQCECGRCVVRFFGVICLHGVMRFEKRKTSKVFESFSGEKVPRWRSRAKIMVSKMAAVMAFFVAKHFVLNYIMDDSKSLFY